ncbi:hypothetical protein [uncultured Clostridium sp.]|uniref:hypothetical protein n=2 Tax=Clostridium cagae TaxID=2080751 RepID=UPI0028EE4371|nr:hypothetical protein [uncultured Clostridium sp.]
MLGLLFMVIAGLSIRVSWMISNNIYFEYKLEGAMLMKMIFLCLMVGNCACGVSSQL